MSELAVVYLICYSMFAAAVIWSLVATRRFGRAVYRGRQ